MLFDKEFKWADSFSEGFACILTQGLPAPTSDDGNKRYSYIDLSGERATEKRQSAPGRTSCPIEGRGRRAGARVTANPSE